MAKKVKKMGFGGSVGRIANLVASKAPQMAKNVAAAANRGDIRPTPASAPALGGSFNLSSIAPGMKQLASNVAAAAARGRISSGTGPAPAPARPMKKGGSVSSASSRADGCAKKGKTKGRII